MNIVERAARIAIEAHAGQMRKDGPPYILHPFMVALLLEKHGFSDIVIAAALTHDVLEDTNVSEEELRAALGEEVVSLVKTVSYDKSLSWEDKRVKYIESVRQGSDGAKAICIADKIHNAESLLIAYEKEGADVWKHFNRGKDKKVWFESEMLKMFQEMWTHPLVEEYASLVEKMEAIPENEER